MRKIRFGIIGGGYAFDFHVRGDIGSDYIEYVAVYDVRYENAQKMASRVPFDIRPYENLSDMLASDIDAVLVAVPHLYHVEIVEQCARAGKHILCEKPMAITVEGCRRMIAAAKENHVQLMIAENHRFLPAHVWIHDAIEKGLLGDILLVRAYEGVDEIAGLSRQGFWKGDPIEAGGGALMDMAAHKFAMLEYILNARCDSVTAMLGKQVIRLPEKAEDNAMAMARFDNGVMAEITVSFTQITAPFNSIEIYGTKGTLFENHAWDKPVRLYSFSPDLGEHRETWYEPEIHHKPFKGYYAAPGLQTTDDARLEYVGEESYYTISARAEDEHFARCLLEGRAPEFTPEQSMSAIECILTGYLSAVEGRTAHRSEILQLADEGRCMEILEKLTTAIPFRDKK